MVESISVLDVFKIGVGPSSSHTLGPWRAALRFLDGCRHGGSLGQIRQVHVDLYGSLAKTGRGHGTDLAVLMGLSGLDPVTCDPAGLLDLADSIRSTRQLNLAGERTIRFDAGDEIVFHRDQALPFHPNALRFTAGTGRGVSADETYYSVGGGFLVRAGDGAAAANTVMVPLPVDTAADVIRHCREQDICVAELAGRNESAWRSAEATRTSLRQIWRVMLRCVHRGCHTDGILPGGLGVYRRAAGMHRGLMPPSDSGDPADIDAWLAANRSSERSFSRVLRWVSCFALAVNEENAAFGRVVTAPTNGAAGVIPAVLMYYRCFCGGTAAGVEDFLLTAGVIGMLFKKGATISAAMGGCQAEIGVSSAMAAAGLCQVLGGSVGQVLMAAEIAMEHHLGMTCDPVCGYVQIPCIERNAMGAVKAINAARLALRGDGSHKVSLDQVIATMRQTGRDMSTIYKETSQGGLAVNVPEC